MTDEKGLEADKQIGEMNARLAEQEGFDAEDALDEREAAHDAEEAAEEA